MQNFVLAAIEAARAQRQMFAEIAPRFERIGNEFLYVSNATFHLNVAANVVNSLGQGEYSLCYWENLSSRRNRVPYGMTTYKVKFLLSDFTGLPRVEIRQGDSELVAEGWQAVKGLLAAIEVASPEWAAYLSKAAKADLLPLI